MEEDHLRPLLRPSTTEDHVTTNPSIVIFRLCLVGFIGVVSIWANHEASKGYAITIVNESGQTLPGKRFQLFYVSNDEATRIILEASRSVESFLYPDTPTTTKKKPIGHIILKLAGQSLTDNIIFDSDADKFVLNMSPSVLEGTDFDEAVILAIRKGIARVWLWDNAPINLINGIVEYIVANMAGSLNRAEAEPPDIATACGSRWVAGILSYFERRRPGFIRRLNVAMKDGVLDSVLENMCTTYRYESLRYNISSV